MTTARDGAVIVGADLMSEPDFMIDGTDGPPDAPLLLLAHGAGAPMDSAFLQSMATLLAARRLTVARCEFQYMARRRDGGPRRPPPKISVLAGEYRAAIALLRMRFPRPPLFIGGKSMGGRIASLIAAEDRRSTEVRGCICLGYPFHPVKQPLNLRTEHLRESLCKTLIVQGERDPFGTRAEVSTLSLSNAITIQWIADGDHDFKPRAASGLTQPDNLETAADAIAHWVMAML